LKTLKLSSSTTLRLDCLPEDVPTLNGHPILPVLSVHFTPIEFRSLKIHLDYVTRVIVMVASTSLPTSPIPNAHDIQLDKDIDAELSLVHDFDNMVDRILVQARKALPFLNLEFPPSLRFDR